VLTTRIVLLPDRGSRLLIAEAELPTPGDHKVVVKLRAAGICHSELHQIRRARSEPEALGHEGVGTVVEVGDKVSSVVAGDSVLITWVPRRARTLTEPLGPNFVQLRDGRRASYGTVYTWAEHALLDEELVVKVPERTATPEAAILGCAVITGAGAVCRTADVKQGESVAIFGAGGVGLSALAAAKLRRADPLIAIDVQQEKLDLARSFGATHTIDSSQRDAVTAIRELTPIGEPLRLTGSAEMAGVDWAFDCIGYPQTIRQIVASVRPAVLGERPGGVAVLVGVPQASVDLEVLDLMENGKTLTGSLAGSGRSAEDLPLFAEWYEQGHLKLDMLVTERYPLEEVNEAVERLMAGKILGRAILELGDGT